MTKARISNAKGMHPGVVSDESRWPRSRGEVCCGPYDIVTGLEHRPATATGRRGTAGHRHDAPAHLIGESVSHPAVPVGKVSTENGYQKLKLSEILCLTPCGQGCVTLASHSSAQLVFVSPPVHETPCLPPSLPHCVLCGCSSPVPGATERGKAMSFLSCIQNPAAVVIFPTAKLNLTGSKQDRHVTPTLSHLAGTNCFKH